MYSLIARLIFLLLWLSLSAYRYIFSQRSLQQSTTSSIGIKKLYDISSNKKIKESIDYQSFYQAYNQVHVEEQNNHVDQQRLHNYSEQFNNNVLRKAVVNREYVLLCGVDILITTQCGLQCQQQVNASNTCNWKTQFNFYQLPLLKEPINTIILDGLLTDHSKNPKNILKHELQCRKSLKNDYIINFLLQQKSHLHPQQLKWKIYNIHISKNENHFHKNNKQTTNSSQKYTFNLKQQNLKQPDHNPQRYYSNGICNTYSIIQQPQLIHYKCKEKQWKTINILDRKIQNQIYQNLQKKSLNFKKYQQLSISYLFLYEDFTTLINLSNFSYGKPQLSLQFDTKSQNYLTLTYVHNNNHQLAQSFQIQLTFNLNIKEEDSFSKLIHYQILRTWLEPSSIVRSQCLLSHKNITYYQRFYQKYYWLYQNKMVGLKVQHSLLCAFTSGTLSSFFRVIHIKDFLNNKAPYIKYFHPHDQKWVLSYQHDFQLKRNPYLLNNISQEQTRNKSLQIYEPIPNKTINDQQQLPQIQQSKGFFDRIYQFFIRQQKIKQTEQQLISFQQYLEQKNRTKTKASKQSKKEKNEKQKKEKNRKKDKQQKKKSKKEKSKKQISKKKIVKQKQLDKQNFTYINGPYFPSNMRQLYNKQFPSLQVPYKPSIQRFSFPLYEAVQQMKIINAYGQKPLILFKGQQKRIFTYKKSSKSSKSHNMLDFSFINVNISSKKQSSSSKSDLHSLIKQLSSFLNTQKKAQQITLIQKSSFLTIQLNNYISRISKNNQNILNQIKSIQSLQIDSTQIEMYRNYLVVVWGWGIDVLQINWDRFHQSRKQHQVGNVLIQDVHVGLEYFLPFIQLFATLYCIFRVLR